MGMMQELTVLHLRNGSAIYTGNYQCPNEIQSLAHFACCFQAHVSLEDALTATLSSVQAKNRVHHVKKEDKLSHAI